MPMMVYPYRTPQLVQTMDPVSSSRTAVDIPQSLQYCVSDAFSRTVAPSLMTALNSSGKVSSRCDKSLSQAAAVPRQLSTPKASSRSGSSS